MAYLPTSTASNTWYTWTCSNTTTSTTNVVVWEAWANNATTSATTATAGPWMQWVCNTATTITTPYQRVREATPEELRLQNEANERWKKQAEEERKKRIAAEERAKELLEANLVLEERQRLSKENHIFVKGRSGCRYRIRKGRSGNIDVVNDKGHITHRLCAHPAEYVPDYDTMLAQKLALETDDENFMRIANRHEHYGDAAPVMAPLH